MRIENRGIRIEDRGVGSESKGAADLLNPQSSILDPAYVERVRWRCRRGLLELDIVLGRFIEQRHAAMNDEQRAIFDELLDLSDTDLWDAITGKIEPPHAHQHEVLEWLKEV